MRNKDAIWGRTELNDDAVLLVESFFLSLDFFAGVPRLEYSVVRDYCKKMELDAIEVFASIKQFLGAIKNG